MPKHEEYEELCALAMVGDASPDELYSLRSHLRECEDCRREYLEFTQLVLPQLRSMDDGSSPPTSEMSQADSARMRASFLGRAQAQGIKFSPKTLRDGPKPDTPNQIAVLRRRRVWYKVAGIAACLLFAIALFWRIADRRPTQKPIALESVPKGIPTVPGAVSAQEKDPAAGEVAKLESHEQELQRALSDLRVQLADADADRTALSKRLEEKTNELTQLQTNASSSQQTSASLRADVAALQARADLSATTFREDQAKVQDLTAQLAQANDSVAVERDMLAAGRDMRDMMAARNLHIVDVFDTDTKGKTNTAFGRIFFAENRKLVFYAYDLNESRLQDTRYDYRIWGQKEGQPRTAKSLGIFYSDDKTQRRWVFKYDDPKVLSEIDSVFVTLEPSTADPQHPRGPQLMYAYLRGQPNHP